jgi:AraC-like DNA-binding protein
MSLTEGAVDLSEEDNVSGYAQQLNEIWEALHSLPGPEERVAMLKAYLMQAVNKMDPGAEPLLKNAGTFYDPSLSPSKVMAEKARISERAIQMRFKKYVGYSSKELLRFLRFKRVVAYLTAQNGKEVDWLDVVVQFGYHDQSHLIRDFKYYTGGTPTRFVEMKETGDFCISRD